VPRRTPASASRWRTNASVANVGKLRDQVGEGAPAEIAVADVIVLLIALDRRFVATRDAQRAVSHDAFRIVDVAENFFHAPLAGGISKVGLRVRGLEQGHGLNRLLFQNSDDVIRRDE